MMTNTYRNVNETLQKLAYLKDRNTLFRFQTHKHSHSFLGSTALRKPRDSSSTVFLYTITYSILIIIKLLGGPSLNHTNFFYTVLFSNFVN